MSHLWRFIHTEAPFDRVEICHTSFMLVRIDVFYMKNEDVRTGFKTYFGDRIKKVHAPGRNAPRPMNFFHAVASVNGFESDSSVSFSTL